MNEQNSHIASAFDRDLEHVQALIMKMGGLVEAAIQDGAQSLADRDTDLAAKVRDGDRRIDQLEEEINQEAARIIALRAPTASDLRTVLTVMKIASSLERCGDFAKNMAKRTSILVQVPEVGGSTKSIIRMARDVNAMLKDALDAFIRRDANLAMQVRNGDQDIDQLYNSIFRELLTHMMEDPRKITGAMHLHFIAKNIERTGDHVSTIADQVIYLVTGEIPEEDRPKDDRTSTTVPGDGV